MTTETTKKPALTAGTKVKVAKGSNDLGISKGVSAMVVEVKELGSEYNYNVSVTLKFLNGFKAGKTFTLTAIHKNRLEDAQVRLRNIMSRTIEVVRV